MTQSIPVWKIGFTKKGRKRGKKNKGTTKHPEKNKMVLENPYLSITILNINGLTSPIKRHGVAKCIKNEDPTQCCLQDTDFRSEVTHRL